LLQRDIDTARRELQELKESNRFANEAMPKVCQLAGLHLSVGDLLGRTMLASNYELAEEHYKQAREIERILLSGASDEEDYVGHVGNSIMTLNSLGQLYSLWQREGDALQVYQEALDCVRHTMSVYGSTPFLQLTLSETLLHKARFTTPNTHVNFVKEAGQTNKNAVLHKHSGRKRSPSSVP